MARAAETTREMPPMMDSLDAQVGEYKYLRDEIKRLEAQQKILRDKLMVVVEETGYEDDKGHQWLEFDHEINGVGALQRTRKVSYSLDPEAAEEVLTGLGLWEDCTDLVRVVNEDKVRMALFDGDITEADIDCIYPQKIVWALNLK